MKDHQLQALLWLAASLTALVTVGMLWTNGSVPETESYDARFVCTLERPCSPGGAVVRLPAFSDGPLFDARWTS